MPLVHATLLHILQRFVRRIHLTALRPPIVWQSNGIHFPWNIQGHFGPTLSLPTISFADIAAAGGPADQWDALPTAGKAQMEIQKRERDLTQPIVTKLREILEGIAKKEDYTVVLEKAENSVMWAKKEIDLTERVVKEYDKK